MFRKILVCSDTSPASDPLIHCASELKTIGMVEVVLAHVLQAVHTEGLDQLLAKEARPILERQKETLEQQGIKVEIVMPVGREPARTLNELAETHNVSAILVGSHGKGILWAATLGSVCADLLNEACRPVLLARIALLEGGKCVPVCRKMFARVLFPTDFSETAEHALVYLGKIATDTKCPVTILHVIEEKSSDAETVKRLDDESRFLIESKKRRLESLGAVDVSIEIVSGKAAAEILAMAKERDFSIIVMGSRGKGLVKEIFMGSVAKEVARHSEVPVLLVPPVR